METSGGSNGGNRRKLTRQLSVVDPSNLRKNLIRSFSNDEDGHRDSLAGLTLGAVLSGEEKRQVRVPPVSRTLFEVINDESGTKSHHHRKNWKSFRDRLRIRRASAAWATSSGNSDDDDSSFHISEPIMAQPISESSQLGNRSNNVTEHDAVTAANEPVMMRLAAALATERDMHRQRQRQVDRESRELHRQRQVDRESINSCPVIEQVRQEPEPAVPEPNQQQQQQQQAESEEEPPVRISLMALLEETDEESTLLGSDELPGDDEEDDGDEDGGEYVCCVCMVRHKGAAFIPCGHTFCRLCSRELWVSRGNCPLCNGYILEILDIF